MLLAVSRFRVANGMEASVRTAFLDRPRLVDHVAGFLGFEVFDDSVDRTIFYLITRWTDADSFRAWHRSDAHRMSHSGIPKGLKLDASFTKVLELDRIEPSRCAPALELLAADHAPLIASFLSLSREVCLLQMTPAGTILGCNSAMARRLGETEEALAGSDTREFLTPSHGKLFDSRLASGARTPQLPMLLEFINRSRTKFALRCHLDVQPDAAILIGEGAEPATVS